MTSPDERKPYLAMRAFVLPLPLLLSASSSASESGNPMNLLLNPGFEFHAFENYRHGRVVSFESHNVAFWNTSVTFSGRGAGTYEIVGE